MKNPLSTIIYKPHQLHIRLFLSLLYLLILYSQKSLVTRYSFTDIDFDDFG
jgi:hypothetical protein